jgi:hypothetical protein
VSGWTAIITGLPEVVIVTDRLVTETRLVELVENPPLEELITCPTADWLLLVIPFAVAIVGEMLPEESIVRKDVFAGTVGSCTG